MSLLWSQCGGIKQLLSLNLEGWRIVEDQSISSTRKLVDSLEEHAILEQLIESVKPNLIGDENEFKGLHYLLFTPFRYPPLAQGTRFGHSYERSLFYGALELKTAMAELAYYRFCFMRASEGKFLIEGHPISKTSFCFEVQTTNGIDLCKAPFKQYREQISDPSSYAVSQALGSAMRADKVAAFISFSARVRDYDGKNINIFTPRAFRHRSPKENSEVHWKCFQSESTVEFHSSKIASSVEQYVFKLNDFLQDGKFVDLILDNN